MQISALPYFSQLAKDYLTNFHASPLAPFFPLPPSLKGLEDFLAERTISQDKREGIAHLIGAQAESLNAAAPETLSAIERLRSPKTFAVVTGQQVTLFGGPLYTIYKTGTAIAVAERLKELYPGFDFVPVFWLETEDHDLDEATHVAVMDRSGDPAHIRYIPEGLDPDEVWKKQVGPTTLEPHALEAVRKSLSDSLTSSEFTEKLLIDLAECYAPGKTFAEAFAAWLYRLFGKAGLLVLDANNREAKSLGKEIFLKELESSPKLSERVVLQTVQLEENYHAQVKPRAINMFYVEDGERYAINEKERKSGEPRSYFLKGSKRTFTHEELRTLIEDEPERFSPNVLLRPLFQDTILPTAAYIGGPGEIAYFAQFRSAYEWAELPMPVIYPRLTATIVEDKYKRALNKNGVAADELLVQGSALVDRLLSDLADEKLKQLFGSLELEIDGRLEALRPVVEGVDRSLDQSLTTLKGKVLTPIRDFSNRVQSADKKRHQVVRDQLNKALTALLPDGELQERGISPIYFLNKYGPEFLTGLLDHIRADVASMGDHLLYETTDLMPAAESLHEQQIGA